MTNTNLKDIIDALEMDYQEGRDISWHIQELKNRIFFEKDFDYSLTSQERVIVQWMMDNPYCVLSPEIIVVDMIGDHFVEEFDINRVRNIIWRIRKKIGKSAIVSVREEGWYYDPQE